jgi:hypothetical protein
MLSADTIVRVLDVDLSADTTSEVWRGRVDQFEADNALDETDSISLRTELLLTGRSFFGGGAAPTFKVEVVR